MGETTDHGVFDFKGKNKEGECEDVEVDMIEFEPSKPETNGEDNKHTFTDELQRSRSHSSSGGERKKKKKKGLKEKIKDKISGDHPNKEPQQKMDHTDAPIADPMARCDNEMGKTEPTLAEEKKGILEKIKEKLPGQHKKPEEGSPTGKAECDENACSIGGETKEKKGIMEKIKEKLPGGHKYGTHVEEVKEKEK
ncbi:hypothetical protein LguiB_022437 [Lonicera macranthoides]